MSSAEWTAAKNGLVKAMVSLGYPDELGGIMAHDLGSPRAIERMTAYLYHERPAKIELIADEMLSIIEECRRWREKKEYESANAVYNEQLNRAEYEYEEDE